MLNDVQSDIASEKPGVLDTLREGVSRLAGWGTPHSGRLIPVWQLVGPTVALRLSHYFISSIANYTVTSTVRSEQQERRVSFCYHLRQVLKISVGHRNIAF